jgi:excinuclease ABC subunit A
MRKWTNDTDATPSLAPIQLRGVRVNNLKNIDVDIPRERFVVVCGVSGSGKTSLVLDTLYVEGQRRFIESFSAYTRQFLGRFEKPEFDRIEQLPPATAVTRSSHSQKSRATVGTTSETYEYLRLLFSKIGRLKCYSCGQWIVSSTPQSVAAEVREWPTDQRAILALPFSWTDRADLSLQLADLQQSGFVRLVIEGRMWHLGRDDRQQLAQEIPSAGSGWIAVDRFSGGDEIARLTDSIETAFARGDGRLALLVESPAATETTKPPSSIGAQFTDANFGIVSIAGQGYEIRWYSRTLRCQGCSIEYPLPEPRQFSFGNPIGACPECEGFGDCLVVDPMLVIPDDTKTMSEGAIAPWNVASYRHELQELLELAPDYDLPLDVSYARLSDEQRAIIWQGVPERNFGGLRGFFNWLDRHKYKLPVRAFQSRWRTAKQCPVCRGERLKRESLAFFVGGKNIAEICSMEIDDAVSFFSSLALSEHETNVAKDLLNQIQHHLNFLREVGLGYLTLGRSLRTLSDGELQRVSLTSALASSLVCMLYVLDEPTAGLHAFDTEKLVKCIGQLRDRGNTVVVVEHDPVALNASDWLIELGPGAGDDGGKITFQGTPQESLSSESLTGGYLSGRLGTNFRRDRRSTNKGWLRLEGATGNNLKNIDVEFPLGVLCLVTGVSGSGKSSLVQETLYGAVARRMLKNNAECLPFKEIFGDGQLGDIVLIGKDSIGRNARSNPATYLKIFDEIRQVFAETIDARTHNLSSSHFSFNHELGQCATCKGEGTIAIDMQFLADVVMQCPDCHGNRYRKEILNVRYRDRSISDVLQMTAKQAMYFFRGQKKVQEKLQVVCDIGLDYLRLGQAARSLSSGESQRLKLASYLASLKSRRTLFVMDEPTTGLHFQDIVRLLDCFQTLLDAGHSMIIVEHNVQMMLAADYIIDLGPQAAHRGGTLVAQGTPEDVAKCETSLTGKVIEAALEKL